MSTIQQQMQMYHALETVLRGAADTQQPLTLNDIWDVAAIRESAPKITHVRDKIKVLQHHNLVTKVGVAASQSGNRMARVGYMWANPEKTSDGEIKFKKSPTRDGHGWPDFDRRDAPPRPQRKMPEVVPEPEQDAAGVDIYFNGCVIHGGRNVEMYISDVKCTVARNEAGKLIIKIE